jgi:hypothetical protein
VTAFATEYVGSFQFPIYNFLPAEYVSKFYNAAEPQDRAQNMVPLTMVMGIRVSKTWAILRVSERLMVFRKV